MSKGETVQLDGEARPAAEAGTTDDARCAICVPAQPVPRQSISAHVTNHLTAGLVAHVIEELREAVAHSQWVSDTALAAESVQEKAHAFSTAARKLAAAIRAALNPS